MIITISVLLTFLISYLREFVLPNVPTMSWGDNVLFATNGTRILAGQMPYRDYFTFLTPGTHLIYSIVMATVSFPAMILLAWLVSHARGPILMAGRALALLSLAIAFYLSVQTQRTPWNYLTLPAGRMAIPDPLSSRDDLCQRT